MNNGIDTLKINTVNIAHITLGYSEIGVSGKKITKPLSIEHLNLVATRKQLWDEYSALVAATASNEYIHLNSLGISKFIDLKII